MDKNKIIYLYELNKQGKATVEEQNEYDSLLTDPIAQSILTEYWDKGWDNIVASDDEINYDGLLFEIMVSSKKPTHFFIAHWRYILLAAATLFAVLATSLFYVNDHGESKVNSISKTDAVKPGINNATLILSNGKMLDLSTIANGRVPNEPKIALKKVNNTFIAYAPLISENAADSMLYNFLTTKKGEQFRVILPDSTVVWLNAESMIKYPLSFSSRNERRIELIGEAYFAVKYDHRKPFFVITKGQTVRDLGTEFNVNCYPDEMVTKTTLVEGAARVYSTTDKASYPTVHLPYITLKPGDQSIQQKGALKLVLVDVDEVISWKKGFFKFRNVKLGDLMRRIARWYNLEVAFLDNDRKEQLFSGTISRSSDIKKIFEMLELSGEVHFKIKNGKVLVSK